MNKLWHLTFRLSFCIFILGFAANAQSTFTPGGANAIVDSLMMAPPASDTSLVFSNTELGGITRKPNAIPVKPCPPVIDVEPDIIEEIVLTGDSLDVPVTISNLGGSDLVWSASISLGNTGLRTIHRESGTETEENNRLNANTRQSLRLASGSATLEAPFDLQLSFNLPNLGLGHTGAEFDGAYFYATRWASGLISKFDLNGNFAEEFQIPGVSQLRDLAYDGTFMYGGAAADTIYMMDFPTKTLIGTFPSPIPVRHIAYEEGADGFWVGDWDSDIVLVDRAGTALASIPAATHSLSGMYGSAYDGWSEGGPYLWVFDQGGGQGFPQLIHQFDLNSGLPTGFVHDVASDFPGTAGIAGGLWAGEGVVPGTASIGGVLQGTPDMCFVYELTETGPELLKLVGPTSGIISPGEVDGFIVRIFGIPGGLYDPYIIITSNDPVNGTVFIPVLLAIPLAISEPLSALNEFAVSRNYPNPFNPETAISYQLSALSNVELVIYNLLGQRVRTLVRARQPAGRYEVKWDGRNDAGNPVSSGLYIYHFAAGDYKKSNKMMLLR